MREVSYRFDPSEKIATFTIDTMGPVNTIGAAFLRDMEAAIGQAESDGAVGIILCLWQLAAALRRLR